jgi:hypothetical protein
LHEVDKDIHSVNQIKASKDQNQTKPNQTNKQQRGKRKKKEMYKKNEKIGIRFTKKKGTGV